MVGAYKLNWDDVKVIKDLLGMGKTHQSIADLFGVSREHITAIKNGTRWNPERHSFEMKSNDYRDFGNEEVSIPQQDMESIVATIEQVEEQYMTTEQKYYLVKFIESLTNKKIKKLVIQF